MAAVVRGHRAVGPVSGVGGPHDEFAAVGALVVPTGEDPLAHGLVVVAGPGGDLMQRGIGERGDGLRRGGGQVAADHERAAAHAPQGEQRSALVGGQAAVAVVAALGAQADVAEREHVGVGPVAGGLERRPAGQACELLVDVLPAVPQVVGDAPHLGVAAQEVHVAGGYPAAGRQRQRDLTPVFGFGFGDGAMVGGDFVGMERGLHVVDLEEVESPGGELVDLRVVPGLCAGMVLVQAVVVRVPDAYVVEVGDVAGRVRGTEHRQVVLDGDAWDAAHHVHAEFQAERVHLFGDRPETAAVGR